MCTIEFFKELKSILDENGVLSINLVAFQNTEIFDIVRNTLFQVFNKIYSVQLGSLENYVIFATNLDLNINEVKDLILNKRDLLDFSTLILKDDALQLKVVFTEAYNNIKHFYPTNNKILTDDKSPIEQIVGMYAFFPS
jgi:hypothetical protein